MKILYIANDRRAAELAAFALRAVAPDVAVAWAAGLDDARRWIDENRDVATLIVEVGSDSPGFESFVGLVRGLGVTAPVIVVSVKDPASPLTALEAAADEIVTKDLSFLNDLPGIVRRTLHTARPEARPARRRLRLLYVGDAALARECLGRPGGSIEVVGAVPGLGGKFDPVPTDVRPGVPPPFEILLLEHGYPGVETLAILKDMAARKLHVPVVIVAEWDEELAVLALELGAHDYVVKSRASFRAVYFRLNRLIAHSALLNEQSRLRDAHAATIGQERATREDLIRRLAEAQTACTNVGQQLNDAVAAIRQARQDRFADAVVAAGHRAQRESDFAARLAEATAARQKLEQQLADRDAALRHAEQRATTEQQAASQDVARRRTELEATLTEAVARCRGFETKLAEADVSLQAAEQRRLAEAAASADKLVQQHAEFTASIAQAVRARAALEQRMNHAVAAIEQARQDRAADAAEAAGHLAQREALLISKLGDAATTQERLERGLADADTALRCAEQRAAAEQHAARQQATERQAQAEAELARETANREALERRLADAQLGLRRAEEQHASEATAADARFAEHLTRYDARVSEAAAAQDALQARLVAAEAALQRTDEQHTSEMAAAAARFAEYRKQTETQMSQAAADAAAALQTAEQQAAAERQAAAEESAHRQAAFDTELRQEVARRQAVEREFADTRAASEQAQLRFLDEVAATGQRAREHETRLEERAARERAEWETARVEGQERIRHLQMEGDLARQSLVATEEQIRRLESAHEGERANFERALTATEANLARERAESTALQRALDRTRATARETLERASQDRATERARLETLVAERETQLQEQAALEQASDEAAARTLADLEHRLRLTLAAGNRDSRAIAQLHEQLEALGETLEAARSQRDVLKTEADRVPQLRKQIDDIRAENRRRFDHTPVSMCRCSRDGAVTQVNHALASFLGYDTPEEVQKVDFAGTVFESGDELQWIVDRCLASRSTESVETTWRRKDGSRVIVRVLAVATTADSVDLAAQDITTFRELEERLRNSQRMEAVARYGSEVAVTCHNLLRHVKQEGQQWLAGIDSDTARYQGGLLLDEVTRAAGFLRQLAVYGNEQKNAPQLVDVNKVLRDLEPVLKRVAGGNIELVLPQASTPLNLDVEAERVERMLINVAAYGRERMPLGGRLMIEVASVVVDRKFVAKYPNVRPGAHVLLTVNEVRGAVPPDFSAAVSTEASGADATAPASNNPGVDLGALQALVSECGGHLWMMADPPGDMVLKIHLPRRVLDRPDTLAPAKRPGRARWITRAFGALH